MSDLSTAPITSSPALPPSPAQVDDGEARQSFRSALIKADRNNTPSTDDTPTPTPRPPKPEEANAGGRDGASPAPASADVANSDAQADTSNSSSDATERKPSPDSTSFVEPSLETPRKATDKSTDAAAAPVEQTLPAANAPLPLNMTPDFTMATLISSAPGQPISTISDLGAPPACASQSAIAGLGAAPTLTAQPDMSSQGAMPSPAQQPAGLAASAALLTAANEIAPTQFPATVPASTPATGSGHAPAAAGVANINIAAAPTALGADSASAPVVAATWPQSAPAVTPVHKAAPTVAQAVEIETTAVASEPTLAPLSAAPKAPGAPQTRAALTAPTSPATDAALIPAELSAVQQVTANPEATPRAVGQTTFAAPHPTTEANTQINALTATPQTDAASAKPAAAAQVDAAAQSAVIAPSSDNIATPPTPVLAGLEVVADNEPAPSASATGFAAIATGGQPAALPAEGTIRVQIGGPRLAVPAEALAFEIKRQQGNGVNRFEIRLQPPELGRIDVRLEVSSDGSMRAHLFADRPETLNLLERDGRNLERAFQSIGLKTDRDGIGFSLRQDGAADGGNGRGDRGQSGTGSRTFGIAAFDDETPIPVIASANLDPMRINIVI
jgi:flagellar hook-length control protein FliK